MITDDILTEIGKFGHPHGINGELQATIDEGIDLMSLKCIVIDIDGINVPFFIKSARRRGQQSWLVMLDDVNNEVEASMFINKSIYGLASECGIDTENDRDGFFAEDLIGFSVRDTESLLKGEIVDIDDSTANVLFIVETESGKRVMIPVADEFIDDVDVENRTIVFDLPEGLLQM